MSLRLKLDENIPQQAEPVLRAMGVDVATAWSERLAGAADPVVLAACIAEDRVLVTLDLDFADVRAYPPGSHRGIWVLRPPRQTFAAITSLAQAGVRLAAVERTAGQLWIVDERQVRIRDGL